VAGHLDYIYRGATSTTLKSKYDDSTVNDVELLDLVVVLLGASLAVRLLEVVHAGDPGRIVPGGGATK
jgi:hypothetical protein